jgi:hypothetical protein
MSTTQKKAVAKPVRYQLKGIELLDFCFNHPKQQIPAQIVFNFDIKLEHKIPVDNNLIAVVVTIDIKDDSRTNKLGSMMASCIYDVPDIKDFIDKKSKVPKLPDAFITTINSITISTVRGLMFSQFRGTFLHNAILPVIDPKSLVSQT